MKGSGLILSDTICIFSKFNIIISVMINGFFFSLSLGTNRYFSRVAATQMGIEVSFVDATDLSKLKSAIKPATKVCIDCSHYNKIRIGIRKGHINDLKNMF